MLLKYPIHSLSSLLNYWLKFFLYNKERQCSRMLKLPHNCIISHASKVMLKILQASNTWTVNFQMFKLVLEKAEEPETCILSCKNRIASLCPMQDTACLGLVHWDDPERCYGEGGGRGVHVWEGIYTRGGFMSMYGKTNTVL